MKHTHRALLTRRHPRRRGSVYVLVLVVSMIVTVIGLSAIMVLRIQRRSFEGHNDATVAKNYAQSAIDIAMLQIMLDTNWRQTYTHNTWVADQAIDRGTFKWKLVDAVDTDLNNNTIDPTNLVVWGMVGQTAQKVSVRLEPIGSALSCLTAAAHAHGNISTGAFDTFTITGARLSTNAVLDNDGIINGDVDANSTVGTGTINGTVDTAAPAKDLPSSLTVFDYYTTNGTAISYAGLPDGGLGTRVMENIVLSPANNPWGSTNPNGIYVIDCQGSTIIIKNCRIVGTVVLLDPSLFSVIDQSVSWEPAITNYPAVLVRGTLNLGLSNTNLDESAQATNFNPVGTPYPYASGAEDTAQDDVYPSQVAGLVYASVDICLHDNTTIHGVLVAGGRISDKFLSTDLPNLTYSNVFFNNPPPGFTAGNDVRIMAGSWKKEVD